MVVTPCPIWPWFPKKQLVLALKGAAPLDSLACARRLTLTTCPPVPEQRRRPPPPAMPPSTTLLCTTVSCKVGEGTPLWQSQIYLAAAAVPSPSLHLSRSRYCFNQLAIRSDDSQEFGLFFPLPAFLHLHVILYGILFPNHFFTKAVQSNHMSIVRGRLGGRANYLYLGLLSCVLSHLFVLGCIWLYLVVFGCSQPAEYCQRQAGPIKGAKLGSRGAPSQQSNCLQQHQKCDICEGHW